MKRLTCSKTPLALHCTWWLSDEAEWYDEPGQAAVLGTEVHSAIEGWLRTRTPGVMRSEVATRFQAWLAWWQAMPHADGATRWIEVAMAYNPQTNEGRQIGFGREAYSELREGELGGTADLVVVLPDMVIVYDWKTGRRHGDAVTSQQLRSLGLAAARTFARETVIVRHAFISDEGVRSEPDDVAELDALELDMQRAWLRGIVVGEPKPGPHCTELYCPAIATCPKTRASAIELAPEAMPIVLRQEAFLSPEHAASAYQRLRMVDKMREQAWEAVKAYVREHGPIPLGGGREYREVPGERQNLDARALVDLARSLGATDAQVSACSSTTSYTSFKETKGRAA